MKVTAMKAPTVGIECLGVSVKIAVHSDDDHISKQLAEHRCFYEEELLLDLHALGRAGIYVDVGANIGNHTLFFAKILGQRVFAFEPFPANLELLKKNVVINNLSKLVHIEGKAVGAAAGQGNLEVPSETNLGMVRLATSGVPCEIVTLDDVLENEDVAVLKIDVEGHEYDVLLGAQKTIRRTRPYLVFEAASLEQHDRVAALIKQMGYVYTRSYSATPTHLYVHEEHLSISRRLGLLLGGIEYMLERRFRGVQATEKDISVNLKETVKRITEIASGTEKLKEVVQPISHLLPHLVNRSDIEYVGRGVEQMEASLHSKIKALDSLCCGLSAELENVSRKLSDSLANQEHDAQLFEKLIQQTEALPPALAQLSALAGLVPEVGGIKVTISEVEKSLISAVQELHAAGVADSDRLKSAMQGLEGVLRRAEDALWKHAEAAQESDRQLGHEFRERVGALKAQLDQLLDQGQKIEKDMVSAKLDVSEALERVCDQFSAAARSKVNELQQFLKQVTNDLGGLRQALDEWPSKTQYLLATEFNRMDGSVRKLSDAVTEMEIHQRQLKMSHENAVKEITEQLHRSAMPLRDTAERVVEVSDQLTRLGSALLTKDEFSAVLRSLEARLDEIIALITERSEQALRDVKASIRYQEVVERQKAAVARKTLNAVTEVQGGRYWRNWVDDFFQARRDRRAIRAILEKARAKSRPVLPLSGEWSAGQENKGCRFRVKRKINGPNLTLRIEFGPEASPRFVKLVLPKAPSDALKLVSQRVETAKAVGSPSPWKQINGPARFMAKGTLPAHSTAVELEFNCTNPDVSLNRLVSEIELRPAFRVGAKKQPLVTVVVTSFNAANTIEKSIESLTTQTWQNLEIIIVDDCSTDRTRDIVEKIAAEDGRVRLLALSNNMGTYCAKNMAIHLARGQFLTFQDSDDVSVPTRIEDQVKGLMKSPEAAVCFCKYVRLDHRAEIVMNRGVVARRAVMAPMWRREKFLEVGYFDPLRGGADAEFIARSKRILGAEALKDTSVEGYFAYHREGSLSRTQAGVDISNETLEEALGEDRARYQSNFEAFYSDEEKIVYRRHLNAGIRQYEAPPGVVGRNHGMNVPVVAALATIPERMSSFKKTFETLIDQVDFLCVYLNNFDSVPEFLRHRKVIVERSEDYGDLKDTGKFFFIDRFPDAYYFTVDDDILYPADYVSSMLFRSHFFGKEVILGVHGVNWRSGFQKFKGDREVFSFRHQLNKNKVVDLLGTGTVMFVPSATDICIADIHTHGMADIWFSVAAKRRNIPLICVSRCAEWLKDAEPQENSLWNETLRDDSPHIITTQRNGPWGRERRQLICEGLQARLGTKTFNRGWPICSLTF